MYTAGGPHKYDFKAARLFLEDESKIAVLPPYEEFTPSPYEEFHEWPEWWLSQYADWRFRGDYVREVRRLSDETADDFGLRWDPERQMLVAPVRTVDGVLAGARGRYVGVDKTKLQHYDYPYRGFRNTHLVWFNERALNLDGPLLIVEGQFDAMKAHPFWPKVMAILSAKSTPYKMKKVYGQREVLLMLDNDVTGRQKMYGTREESGLIHDLQRRGIRVAVIEYPTMDENHPAYFKDAGDAPDLWLAETFMPA
jgi:hypothetical protein